MATVNHLPSIDGAIVFWRTSDSDKNMINAALGKNALADESDDATLKRSLTDYFGGPNVLIRPLKGEGFVVVDELRSTDGNQYTERFTARVDSGRITIESNMPVDHALLDQVDDAFRQSRQVCPAHRVATGMVHAIEAAGGIPLRPQGAIYYLPPHSVPEFKKLAEAIEAASITPRGTCVYLMKTPTDANTARAVLDALVIEATAEVEKISEDVQMGDLGKRALEGREKRAMGMLSKLESYEQLFGLKLDEVRESINTVRVAAATSAMLVAAQVDQPGVTAPAVVENFQ